MPYKELKLVDPLSLLNQLAKMSAMFVAYIEGANKGNKSLTSFLFCLLIFILIKFYISQFIIYLTNQLDLNN